MPEKLWIPPRPDIRSFDSNPGVSITQKLKEIKAKTTVRVVHDRQYQGLHRAQLPYTKGISFFLEEDSPDISLWDLDLGDKALYGHGIGTRLVQRVVEYSLNRNPNISTISRGVGNWALAKTISKVVGGDQYVTFEKGEHSYGIGSRRPIDAVLVDYPPNPEGAQEYGLQCIAGVIEKDRLLSQKDAVAGITTTAQRA